jgi:hypothetical protein
MFRPSSLKLPSPTSIAAKAFSSSVYLFFAGLLAAGVVTAMDGGYCHYFPGQSPYMCDIATANERTCMAISMMALYTLYLLLGPTHNNHDHMLIFSHETSWIHAISNWLSRLAAGINPLTANIGDFMNAAADTNTRYQRHNILTFLFVVLATVLFAPVMFGPWLISYYVYPQGKLVLAMLAVLVGVYILIAFAFLMIGSGVLFERKHTDRDIDG